MNLKKDMSTPRSYMLYNEGDWPPNMNQGNVGAQASQQQLSVVTTVWGGVSTTTQSGPLAHNNYGGANTTMAQTPYSAGQQSYPGPIVPKPYSPALMNVRQNGSTYNNYVPTSMSGTSTNHNGNGEFQQQSLNSAALVAAAATATATATASVVALQERQQGPNSCNQYGPVPGIHQAISYDRSLTNQRMQVSQPMNNSMGAAMNAPMNISGNMSSLLPNSVPPITNGPCPVGMSSSAMNRSGVQGMGGSVQPSHGSIYPTNAPGLAPQSRTRAYPTPQQHLAQKRPSQYNPLVQQYGPNMPPYAGPQHSFNPNQYQGPPQPRSQQYASTVPASSINPAYLTQAQVRPLRAQAPPYTQAPYYPPAQMNGAAPPGFDHQQQYVQYSQVMYKFQEYIHQVNYLMQMAKDL